MMRIRDILLALLTMALWGLNFAMAKMALAEFPPMLLAALRFLLVALLLVPFCKRPQSIRPIVELAAVLGILHFPMIFSGLARIDSSTSAIVMQLQVPLGVVMAALLLDEKLNWRHGLGMLIAFAGVALIAGAPRLGANRIGLLFLLIAALAWGYSTVQLKRIGSIDGFTLNGWLAFFMTVELAVLSLMFEGSPLPYINSAGWRGWTGILYTAIASTIAAFSFYAGLVARYSVGQVMPFMLTIPLFAMMGGVAINHDAITPDIVAGGLLTILGVGLIVLRKPRGRNHTAMASPS